MEGRSFERSDHLRRGDRRVEMGMRRFFNTLEHFVKFVLSLVQRSSIVEVKIVLFKFSQSS